MSRSLPAVSLPLLAALAGAACGAPPQPPPSGCTTFPDTCPEGEQCLLELDYSGSVCAEEGALVLGDACEPDSVTTAGTCGRELVCVLSGAAPARCLPLCEMDVDCETHGLASACTPTDSGARRVCPLD